MVHGLSVEGGPSERTPGRQARPAQASPAQAQAVDTISIIAGVGKPAHAAAIISGLDWFRCCFVFSSCCWCERCGKSTCKSLTSSRLRARSSVQGGFKSPPPPSIYIYANNTNVIEDQRRGGFGCEAAERDGGEIVVWRRVTHRLAVRSSTAVCRVPSIPAKSTKRVWTAWLLFR